MSSYTDQKTNLVNQGWHCYLSQGGMSYFAKKDVSGLVVSVSQTTGAAKLHEGCPKYFADLHKPELIH